MDTTRCDLSEPDLERAKVTVAGIEELEEAMLPDDGSEQFTSLTASRSLG